MQLVSADIRAFLAGSEEGSCPAGSSKQQLQLLLPHPQLVVCVLVFAALRYKRLHKQLLRLSTERVARPDWISNMDEVIHFLIGHAEPLVAPAALSAIGAAAAAVGAGEAAMVGAEAAAAAEGVGTATAAATTAGAGGGRAGDGGEGLASAGAAAGAAAAGSGTAAAAGADAEEFSTYSSALHELLQAISDVTKAASSPNPHIQQQDEQQQQEWRQQLLPPAWAMLLQGNTLKVLLPALSQAAGELHTAVAAVVPHLQQTQQRVRDTQAQLAVLSARVRGYRTLWHISTVSRSDNAGWSGCAPGKRQSWLRSANRSMCWISSCCCCLRPCLSRC